MGERENVGEGEAGRREREGDKFPVGNEIFIEFIGVSPRTFFFFRIFVPIHICYLLISQFTKFETISKRGDSRNRRYGAAAGNEKERMGRKKERGKEGRSA